MPRNLCSTGDIKHDHSYYNLSHSLWVWIDKLHDKPNVDLDVCEKHANKRERVGSFHGRLGDASDICTHVSVCITFRVRSI